MKILYSAFFISILILLDQFSKNFVLDYLKTMPGYVLDINSFVSFVIAWNHGVSFGLFGDYYQYSNFAFIIINSLVVLYLMYLLTTKISNILFIAYNMIIGGAIGNLYCRIEKGAVYDFIYLHIGKYGFAVFNVADSFIFIGVCILIYNHIKEYSTN